MVAVMSFTGEAPATGASAGAGGGAGGEEDFPDSVGADGMAHMADEMLKLEWQLSVQEEQNALAMAQAVELADEVAAAEDMMEVRVQNGAVIGYTEAVTAEVRAAEVASKLESAKRDLATLRQNATLNQQTRNALLAEIDALTNDMARMEMEMADYYDKAATFQQMTWGNWGRQMNCTRCHQQNPQTLQVDVDGDDELDLAVGDYRSFITSAHSHACPAGQSAGKAPTVNLVARFEGDRVRIGGEVQAPANAVAPAANSIDRWIYSTLAENQFTIDLSIEPEVVEFDGFINYAPINNTNDVVEFDAVLADNEVLMLEVSRNEHTRTLVFVQAKKLKGGR